MNIIQMLNIWRWFTKETLLPLLDNEIEYPTWFWTDDKSAGFSCIDVNDQMMKEPMDFYFFGLSRKDKFPVYFILDKNECSISDLEEKHTANETYRTWLTDEENEKLYKRGVEEKNDK